MLYISEKIFGKWNKNEYIVLSKLGEGGIGAVYKVKGSTGNIRALKISRDISSITREFDMMNKLKSIKHIPRAYEVDDYEKDGEVFYFFIMDYIEGYSIKDLIKHKDMKVKEIIGIGIILLNLLEIIYRIGYVYADIKPENIMLDKKKKRISFIDFGGVILKGQGIREYTPAYSMISWGIERNYDSITSLNFSIAMIITSMLLKKEFNPLIHNLEQVIWHIKHLVIDEELKKILIEALKCEIIHTDILKDKLKKAFKKTSSSLKAISKSSTKIKSYGKPEAIDAFFFFSMGLLLIVVIIGLNIYF